jgi:hypothetical protein
MTYPHLEFFREHFDLRKGEHGVHHCYPKTWEARDFLRTMTVGRRAADREPPHPYLTTQLTKGGMSPAVYRFSMNYRFNTRKHPKRGAATHASVNT